MREQGRVRGIKGKAMILLLSAALVAAPARRAHAIAPAVIAAAAATIYYAIRIGMLFFGSSGPDISAQLNAIENTLLAAITAGNEQSWKASAQTVLDDVRILGNNPPGYGTNVS